MSEESREPEAAVTYDSDDKNGGVVFRCRMNEDTEIGGFIKLRVLMSAPDHDDMDIEVTLEKRNRFGGKIGINPMKRVVAKGYIRASLRELDSERSREEYPFQSFKRSVKLKKGEYLCITVNAYKTSEWKSPFDLKMAKIKVPAEGFTYMPKAKPRMITVGGVSGGLTGGVDITKLPHDVNRGRHIIYTDGKYDSYLYLPIVE